MNSVMLLINYELFVPKVFEFVRIGVLLGRYLNVHYFKYSIMLEKHVLSLVIDLKCYSMGFGQHLWLDENNNGYIENQLRNQISIIKNLIQYKYN